MQVSISLVLLCNKKHCHSTICNGLLGEVFCSKIVRLLDSHLSFRKANCFKLVKGAPPPTLQSATQHVEGMRPFDLVKEYWLLYHNSLPSLFYDCGSKPAMRFAAASVKT